MNKFKAIVSAHIYLDDKGQKDIEILSQVDNDNENGIFDDLEYALRDNIEIGDSDDYFFIAMVESEIIKYETWEGVEYSVEHYVTEIKSINDIR